jgi:hypothetical protein
VFVLVSLRETNPGTITTSSDGEPTPGNSRDDRVGHQVKTGFVECGDPGAIGEGALVPEGVLNPARLEPCALSGQRVLVPVTSKLTTLVVGFSVAVKV